MKTRIVTATAVWYESQIVLSQKLKLTVTKMKVRFLNVVHLRLHSYTQKMLSTPCSFCACVTVLQSLKVLLWLFIVYIDL